MKTSHNYPIIEARTLSLVAGVLVGLGIVIHELFLVVALALGVAGVVTWGLHRRSTVRSRWTPQHP